MTVMSMATMTMIMISLALLSEGLPACTMVAPSLQGADSPSSHTYL